MKNIITAIVLVFAFTLTVQAQKKGKKKKPSVEKALQKITKDLNLSEAQQNEIKPLLVDQFADRAAMKKAQKAMKESGEKPTKEQRKQLKADRKAKHTAFNTKMATILNKEQLVIFEENAKKRKGKGKKKKKKQ